MLARSLDSLGLVILWVSTLAIIFALVGIVIAIIPLGWAPMSIYACVGLGCAWELYRRTVSPNSKPVTRLLTIQCWFFFGVSLICFLLGQSEAFGFTKNASQVAALPVVFFSLIFIRRSVFGSEKDEYTVKKSWLANCILFFAYLWIVAAILGVVVCMAGTMMTGFYDSVSLLISPLNLISWLVIVGWFFPAFLLRALGRKLKRVVR